MFPSTLRTRYDPAILDDDRVLAAAHGGLLDVAGPIVKPAAEDLGPAVNRLMGDLEAMRMLVEQLRGRIQVHRPNIALRRAPVGVVRPSQGVTPVVVAINEASRRLAGLHLDVAVLIVALSE